MRQTSLSHKAVGSSSSSSVHMRTARRRCAVAAKASTQNDDSSVHRQSSARLPARRRCAVIAKAASPNDGSSVHNGRLPFLEQLKQFVSPQQYARMTLNGHKLAWGKTGLSWRAQQKLRAHTAHMHSKLLTYVRLSPCTTFLSCLPPTHQHNHTPH